MREICLCWSVVGRQNIVDDPIQNGLWMPFNEENQRVLQIICEEGNAAHGEDTHWIEEREA